MSTVIKSGDKVRVKSLRDRPIDSNTQVGNEGVVRALRVSDGTRIGYIVEFSDRTTNWFFDEELELI